MKIKKNANFTNNSAKDANFSKVGIFSSSSTRRVSWRSVAVPREHGGWGFLLDPILLGLLVAPSAAGIFLVLLDLASFLARTPLKIVWKDSQSGRHRPLPL